MKKIAAGLLICCCACTAASSGPQIKVNFIYQHKAVSFKGLDEAVLHELERDRADWKNVFPVYKMPADTGDKNYQRPQPGKYAVAGDSLIFTPDTPFVKRQLYFTRFQQYSKQADAGKLFRGMHLLSPNQYQEIIFKY